MARFDPFQELERFSQALFGERQGPRMMPMDVYREGDHYILNADLPGIDPGSVDVDVDGQMLSIRAQRTMKEGEGTKWLLRERTGGTFLRQITMGQDIDVDNIHAHYENGVLSMTIPIKEAAKPRKIEVMAGHRDAVEGKAEQKKVES
ncbi:Hsp20/alpha crystallin family protein [Arthrobacter sp. E918]|uniref:Hsp20/alpha crystallin family protein n=1 Tax=Arthrobacter mobilis TaxID=2724944 RepID=A0A7X6HDQ5_9MICC|nr:Hsp20/alpha crystallin family protein [Arthrobacter mobilis]